MYLKKYSIEKFPKVPAKVPMSILKGMIIDKK